MKLRHLLPVFGLLPLVACGPASQGNDTGDDTGDDTSDGTHTGDDDSGASTELTSSQMLAQLPTADLLVVPYPGTSAKGRVSLQTQAQEEASCAAAEEDGTAQFYRQGCQVVSFINGTVNDVLQLIADITSQPPNHVGENQYAWGPYPNDQGVTIVFVMQKNTDGTFGYNLAGKPTGTDDSSYLTVIGGQIYEAVSATKNNGAFQINYDNMKTLNPANEVAGIATYVYDKLDAQTGVEANLQGIMGGDGALHNFGADYDLYQDHSGELRYGYTDDLVNASAAQEVEKANTRWLSTGAGRADVTVSGGDLGSATGKISECWDTGYMAVYEYRQLGSNLDTAGDAGQCVYADAEYL